MFNTVIWATDGSATAARALPQALELVEKAGGTLIAAHVRELIAGKGGGYPVFADDADLRERLQEQVDDLRSRGVDAKLEHRTCLSGRVGATITEIAEEAQADVIVVGTHGHTRLGQLLVGSVTQELLHIGKYPVLAIPTARVAAAV